MNFWNSIANFFLCNRDEQQFNENMQVISTRVDALMDENASLKQLEYDIKSYTDEIKRQKEMLEGKARCADVAINFNVMKAFSIERMYGVREDGEKPEAYTVIGYMFNNEIKEWYVYCNDEHHNRLVAEFKASLIYLNL